MSDTSMKMQLIIEALNKTDRVFNELRRELRQSGIATDDLSSKSARAGDQVSRSFNRGATQVGLFQSSVANAGVQLVALWMVVERGIGLLDRLAFQFSATLETAQLGIATAFVSAGEFTDQVTGKVLEGHEALAAAQEKSAAAVKELQVDNFLTIATLDQLVRAYQETLPVAMRKGFDPRQAKEFTVAMVQAAGAIGLSLDQMAEETRSLLTGTINPRTSRIGVILGLENKDIRENSANAEQLFSFLMGKLEAYQVAGVESQKTWKGAWSNTQDIFKQMSAMAFEPLFEHTKQQLGEISDQLIDINSETKQIDWNPEFLAGLENFKTGLSEIIVISGDVVSSIGQQWDLIVALTKVYVGLKVAAIAYNVAMRSQDATIAHIARITAARAERAAILAAAQAEVVLTRAMAARQAWMSRAAVGATRLAAAENKLTADLIRQSVVAGGVKWKMTAGTKALTAAENQLTGVMARQAVVARGLKWSLAALGGPLGLIITVLGTAATMWWAFGDSADEASEKARTGGDQVLDNLREQVRAIKERNRIAGADVPGAEFTDRELERLAYLRSEISRLQEILAKPVEPTSFTSAGMPIFEHSDDDFSRMRAQITALKAEIVEFYQLKNEAATLNPDGDISYKGKSTPEKDAKERANKLKEYEARITELNADALKKRLLQVDRWVVQQRKLLESAGLNEEEVAAKMVATVTAAEARKTAIRNEHAEKEATKSFKEAERRLKKLQEFEHRLSEQKASELDQRLLQVDKWVADERRLLVDAGVKQEEIEHKMVAVIQAADERKEQIRTEHAEKETEKSIKAAEQREQKLVDFEERLTRAKASELKKRLMDVDAWARSEEKLLVDAGLSREEISWRMVEVVRQAETEKSKIIVDHQRGIREAAIQTALAEIDLAEKSRTISRADAVEQRVALYRELLVIQEEYLASLSKIKDPTAWQAQADAIRETRAALLGLKVEVEKVSGTFGGGMAAGIEEYMRKQRTAFESGKQLALETAQSMESTFSNVFFDAMEGKLESFGDYVRSFVSSVNRALANTFAQKLTGGLGSLFGFADGAAFLNGQVVPFADGTVISGPTFFPMFNNKVGLMGEDGEEAIMPLARGKDGKLGVRASGGGGSGAGSIQFHQEIHIDARGADSGVENRIRQAVEQGGRQGYELVVRDLRTRGPAWAAANSRY